MKNCSKRFVASMTVEASLVLPMFIFFFVNVMTLFNIVKVQSDLEAALHQTGSEMTLRAFDLRFGEGILGEYEDSGIDTLAGAAGILWAKEKIRNYLDEETLNSCVTGGYDGISFLQSRVLLGNDYIDIVMDYKVHPLISLIGFKEFPLEGRFFGHAWTGYDIQNGLYCGENEEEMVYVTEHGEVYHRSIDCEHLHVKVRSVDYREISSLRNNDRKKYYACEYCGGHIYGGNVFVTGYGEKYHSSVNCPGLKRKIYTIPLSEALGKRPCSSCGQ